MKVIVMALLAAGLVLAALVANVHVYAGEKIDDATIFAIFDQAHTTDVWVGRIAAKRAHSAEVRALGKMVASDHEAVEHAWRDLAKKLGILPVSRCCNASSTGEARRCPKNWDFFIEVRSITRNGFLRET